METSVSFFQKYKTWIVKHPIKASELESTIKWTSYLLVGRFKNSSLLCEIVYSGSRLFEMFNDFMITGKFPQLSKRQLDRLTVLLTVIEYVEVLIEVAAEQMWGEQGRWAVVAMIQLLKAIWRFLLLIRHKVKLMSAPPIKPINRTEIENNRCNVVLANGFETAPPVIMKLPHSGRVMRTLAGAPPPRLRTYSPPPDPEEGQLKTFKKDLSFKEFTSEMLHILRPIGHLGSMYCFGLHSWVPWFLSLGVDLTSIHLHSYSALSPREKAELAHRRLSLLYYLIRTPAFQTVTQEKIDEFLLALSRTVPLARFICGPLRQYIPQWQRLYAYTWS